MYPKSAGPGFFEAIGICFSKYAAFAGRAPRSEFWWWSLFQSLIAAAFMCMTLPRELADLARTITTGVIPPQDAAQSVIQFISTASSVALFLPTMAVSVRRLHDIGKSGW